MSSTTPTYTPDLAGPPEDEVRHAALTPVPYLLGSPGEPDAARPAGNGIVGERHRRAVDSVTITGYNPDHPYRLDP